MPFLTSAATKRLVFLFLFKEGWNFMEREIRPTLRHKRLLAAIPKSKTLGEAMDKAGYFGKSKNNPKKVMESQGFQQLAAKVLPDNLLFKVHREGLAANKIISARITSKEAEIDTDDFIEVPDHPTRHKFLETGYKIRGKLVDEPESKPPMQVNILVQQSLEKIYDSPGETSEGSKG